jgi:hypothetical protein
MNDQGMLKGVRVKGGGRGEDGGRGGKGSKRRRMHMEKGERE